MRGPSHRTSEDERSKYETRTALVSRMYMGVKVTGGKSRESTAGGVPENDKKATWKAVSGRSLNSDRGKSLKH